MATTEPQVSEVESVAASRFEQLVEMQEQDPELDKASRQMVLEQPVVRPLELQSCEASVLRYARRWLRIRHQGDLLPLDFRVRPAQMKLGRLVKKIRDDGLPVRIRILKARQLGFSTMCEGDGFHIARFKKHMRLQVVAHDLKASRKIYGIFKCFLDNLPAWMRPEMRAFSQKEGLHFADTDCQLFVDTAKDASIRGGTPDWVHASELAFWPGDPVETKTALYQPLGLRPGTTIYEETTANGIANDFYNSWHRTQKEMRVKGRTTWVNIFFAWHENPDYQLPMSKGEAEYNMTRLDREETFLVERFGLTPQQLKWRRSAISDLCEGDINRFKQEYPAYAEEAFRSTGQPYFSTKVLVGWRREMEPDPGEDERKGFIEHLINVSVPRVAGTALPGVLPNGVRVVDAEDRTFEIIARLYQTPQPGVRYVLAADVAEGQQVFRSDDRKDPDWSVGMVLRLDTREEVAFIRGQWEPDIFGEALISLGTYYNFAMIAPEAHSIGEAVILWISRQVGPRGPYPNIYHRIVGETKAALGWQTSTITRPQMLSESRRLIREGEGRIRTLLAIDEHLAMERRAKDGKVMPKQGKDDTVMTRAIGVCVCAERAGELADEEEHVPTTTDEKVQAYERDMFAKAQVDYEPEGVEEDWH